MKKNLKKTMTTLIALVMSAGMILPQTVSPFGSVLVYAEEAVSVDETVSLDDSDLLMTASEEETSEEEESTAVIAVSTEDELRTAVAAASTDEENPTIIELQSDITLTQYLQIVKSTYVEMRSKDGEQYTLKASDDSVQNDYSSYGILYIRGNLTLKNVICDANQKSRVAYIYTNGVLQLGDGAVLENGNYSTTTADTGGVYVYTKATLILYKGSVIQNNSVTVKLNAAGNVQKVPTGMGVYVAGSSRTSYGTVYMYGGTITNNDYNNDYVSTKTRVSGGGVYLGSYTQFYMYGGTISDNDITGIGAGICGGSRSTIVLGRSETTEIEDESVCDDKVLITNNTITDDGSLDSPQYGAGIYTSGTLIIQAIDDADTVISNNIVYNETYKYPESTDSGEVTPSYKGCGGGIFATGTYADVTMTGGTITGNQAICEAAPTDEESEDLAAYHYANGGGIYIQEGTFTMTGGQITGNSASSAWEGNSYAGVGGGLCVGFKEGYSDVTVTLTGGTISGNTAAAGSDIYLTNAIPSYQGGDDGSGGTTYSDDYVLYSASDLLYVGGSVKIGEIYLPADVENPYNTDADGRAVIHMVSALTNTNAIGVTLEDPKVGTVIVEGEEDGYAIGYADELAFYCVGDDSTYDIRLDSDGNLSLQTPTAATYLAKASVTFADEDKTLTYTGGKLTPEPTVTLSGETLVKGTDYILTYSNNVDAGTATVTVNGIGSYTGSATATFTIEPLDISTSEDVTVLAIDDRIYTGEAWEPTVTVYYNDETLTQGDADSEDAYDYSVAYTDNTDRGIATATITGHGNFAGSIDVEFNIIDVEGTTVVSDGATLERVIEAAADTSEEDPLIITLADDVILEVTEATQESEETETSEEDTETTEEETEALAATDAMITLPEGEYVQILGYNHTITVETDCFAAEDASETGMFIVTNGSELTLENVTVDGQYHERLLYVMNGGNAEVGENATLTRGRATDISGGSESNAAIVGGQAIWNAGTVTFEGSLSTNSTSANYYGAIYNAESGSFTMTDGSQIENILILAYGAIYNVGSFTMDGGTITETTVNASANFQQGMAVYNVGSFTMKDGSAITKNSGANSTIYNTGSFFMEGGEISANENSSDTMANGTVYMYDGTFEMTGGSISGNQTYLKGGGIYIAGGVVTINGEDAEITGNRAVNDVNMWSSSSSGAGETSVGGGIYMRGGELNFLAGSIDNNEAYFVASDDGIKYAYLGNVYSTDGVYSEGETFSHVGHSGSNYGIGGGIFVDSGILTIGDGAVIEGNYSPIASASGIVIAEDMFGSNDDEASQIYFSGSPQISDTIWLDEGKSILISGDLGDGDETYQVYQQETDFKLMENGGTAVARYTDEAYMNENDGDKFTVYPYDAEWDFEADTTLDRYTALSSAITGASAGIYANYAPVDISAVTYVFTDAYSTDEETGTAQYKYNGYTRKPAITATAALGTGDDAAVIDVTKNLTFTYEDAVSAGDYTVTVTTDSYHITDASGEGCELTFRIIPVDLSDPGEASDRWQVSVSAEDVAYDTVYPDGTLTETTVTAQVRLGTVSWKDLVQADSADSETGDYYVTYENNEKAGTATAVLHGINNYSGELSVEFEITAVESSGADTFLIRRGTIYYFFFTLKGGNADYRTTFGYEDDQVLIGDWDGDGLDTVCVRRGNVYYFTNSIDTMEVELTVTYGRDIDEVLVGDWDGDGKDSLAMRRNGCTYYFCNDIENPDEDTWRTTYGRADDEVIVGDWENSGYDSLGVRRNGNVYYFSLSEVTEPDSEVWRTTYGRTDDQVLVGDWDGDGTDTLAMRRNGIYYYTTNSISDPDAEVDRFEFGRATDEVYAGTWK